ncbi:tripartite tricarboxylate transporter substrate binding protein [Bradyrhizobium sp.]|uniref:Bug family tripartite tricarboxylate transporter substrate binding protein n=1 Tax=Bradyrhizobium sp. TaxID=376 RepID=UPI001D253475|nr:tripartite tricarboxylate transporter substrate binding protein [Bradyrhizobium sp.]MBI5323423.1 tripartite tricarboxylate transporter substrate binding protein [Bradyrhizobium sp.]
MRRTANLIGVAVALAGMCALAEAQTTDWPTRPVTLIVPFTAGGGIDANARLQALVLGEILGQSVVVENVGAASGTVGSARVAKAAPDGYTLLIGNSGTHAYSQSLFKKIPYNAVDDFAPVGLVSESPRILIVRKDFPADNLGQFIAYVKANQAQLRFGSAGIGSGTHLPCARLNLALGVDVTHVPYRGAGGAMQDLIGGRIDYMCDTIQTGAAQVKGGSVKAIAVMAAKRAPNIPDIPTTAEQGLAGVEATVWNGFFFPRGTPQPIVQKMNRALQEMLERPDIRTKMQALGLEVVPPEQRTPEYLAGMLPREIARWAKVIKDAGISMD